MSSGGNVKTETIAYDDKIVRQFVTATVIWGLVAFLVGLIVALQLASWRLNFGTSFLTFGRLRPLHTNAAIFAFGGNAIFAGIYYSMQRLLKTRLLNDTLSAIHFWGWQLIILLAALTLPFGITHGKEYAELEWPIDLLITVIWVVFAVNFFGTLMRRRERHIYVAIWFYIATIITVAVLHIVNSIEVPVSLFKSYPIYAGIHDAMVQWWYGHNAVAFFLTTPFLGLMYYFVPKAANRPVYSYRLSIIHFWSLVFMYIWAGPHHLLNSAVPEWAQTLGMVFSVALWAPSWGGMVNGLLTLRGVWDKVRTEPILKFFVVGITFYGMSTFEGPLLSIKSVNSLAHYTDWIIGHVHEGTLGWNGFITMAMIYFLVPKLWKREIYSKQLMNYHFWFATIGIIVYVVSMWISGVTQGLMWRAMTDQARLVYPDFVETVTRIVPMYWARAFGGTLYIVGYCFMIYNLVKTIASAPKDLADEKAQVPVRFDLNQTEPSGTPSHRRLEGMVTVFTVLALVGILVGSIFSLAPMLFAHAYVDMPNKIKPYTALELAGRDVYIKEGCYNCHSQMIRTSVSEVLRYGPATQMEESMYDHPFQWGSKRTGPDIARVGGKYTDMWHYRHMFDPRAVVANSIMPEYTWLFTTKTDFAILSRKFEVLKQVGVPYSADEIANAEANARAEAKKITEGLVASGGGVTVDVEDKEIIALIAYMQRLGRNPEVIK